MYLANLLGSGIYLENQPSTSSGNLLVITIQLNLLPYTFLHPCTVRGGAWYNN